MAERWMPINGFEGLYEVSNYGRVKSLNRIIMNKGGLYRKRELILKQRSHKGRHLMVVLCKEGRTYPKLVHRLVAEAFIQNPYNKPVVDHIDTNPQNNHVDNLRWVTIQENCLNPLTREHNSSSKMGHKYYGRPLTDEERAKISMANKGRKLTEEQRERLSIARKNSPIAIKASQDNIKKAHKANAGTPRSETTKQKIREKLIGVHKGKHWTTVDGKRVWI